jgi:hypothetical protein
MLRNAIIAVSACVYIGLSAWLVGRQGQAYREGLRHDRPAAEQAAKPQELPKHDAPNEAVALNTDTKSHPAPEVAAVEPAKTHTRDQANPAAHAKTKDKGKRPGKAVADSGAAKKEPHAQTTGSTDPLAANPFWSGPEMMKNWDVASLSAADEERLGAMLHDVIVTLNPVASDGPWRQRLEEAAKPFLKTVIRKDIHYHFEVMESLEVNAFSHPGGYVYVNRGLFDLVGEDEPYALEFAVGNEIAHVDLQHALKCLQDPDFKEMTGGTIRKLYWLILPMGYLENQDYEADTWTFTRMRNFGRSRREGLAFLNKLDGYATKHGFHDGRGKVRLSAESASLLDIRYRRQTAAYKRLEHLKEAGQ